ncbi:MAG: leucine-rich repeat domain-containing protein, partial [Verrucomicrobiota bacterium]
MKTTKNVHGITLALAWRLAATLKERIHPLKSTGVFSFRQCCFTLLFLLVLPVAVRAQFTYTTNGSSVTITGYTGPGGAVVIPSSTNGHTVTGIGTEAFQSSLVTSVVIPTSITNIGVEAFVGCPNLTNISVTTGSSSFSSINGVLFDRGQDTLIEYPEGLTPTNGTYTILPYSSGSSIGPYAFADCSRLTNLVLVTVTNIGEYAFAECTDLTSVTVTNYDGDETSIEPYAFAYCSRLTNVLTYNVNIEDFAFTECTSLTSITIPTPASFSFYDVKPTSVGVAAFTFCTSLTNVVIGSTVTNIGGLAFAFCTNLTSAYFASNAPPDVGTAFDEDPAATVYYEIGTTGWGP